MGVDPCPLACCMAPGRFSYLWEAYFQQGLMDEWLRRLDYKDVASCKLTTHMGTFWLTRYIYGMLAEENDFMPPERPLNQNDSQAILSLPVTSYCIWQPQFWLCFQEFLNWKVSFANKCSLSTCLIQCIVWGLTSH